MKNSNRRTQKQVTFIYKFSFDDGTEQQFTINLDGKTFAYIPILKGHQPLQWTKLSYSKCENCPLDINQHKYCPIALNFVDLFDFFKSIDSYHDTEVEIEAPERSYCKKTTVQRGLGSMLGIYMVTSGCPVMEVLKPMVRFHLPFASIEETIFKSIGSYLIGQYFLLRQGKEADFKLEKLRSLYLEIQKVNSGIVRRLRPVIAKDAFANAIISLDAFAKELPWSIEDGVQDLEYLYTGFFK